MEPESGFSIHKRYEVLYRRAIESRAFHRKGVTGPVYAIPISDDPVPPDDWPCYRGLCRDDVPSVFPVQETWFLESPYSDTELFEAARAHGQILMRIAGEEDDYWSSLGWTETIEDALHVWNLMGERRHDYEIIFARPYKNPAKVPDYCEFLGCDVSNPVPNGFSCISDALFFPHWHGSDAEGELFAEHFARLNQHGLFDTHNEAFDYLRHYLSFDWTEHSDFFSSIEVYAVDMTSVQ